MYLNNKWILVDPVSGEYILDYNNSNLVIPITKSTESKGYYVMLKGLDHEEYGIRSLNDLKYVQQQYAKKIKENFNVFVFSNYTINKF